MRHIKSLLVLDVALASRASKHQVTLVGSTVSLEHVDFRDVIRINTLLLSDVCSVVSLDLVPVRRLQHRTVHVGETLFASIAV